MLPKAYLILHSRISGSRWVITPLWLSGLWRSFLYSSSVYSHHLFLISSASVRSIPFLSFVVPIFAWNVPLVSRIFLKRSLVLEDWKNKSPERVLPCRYKQNLALRWSPQPGRVSTQFVFKIQIGPRWPQVPSPVDSDQMEFWDRALPVNTLVLSVSSWEQPKIK